MTTRHLSQTPHNQSVTVSNLYLPTFFYYFLPCTCSYCSFSPQHSTSSIQPYSSFYPASMREIHSSFTTECSPNKRVLETHRETMSKDTSPLGASRDLATHVSSTYLNNLLRASALPFRTRASSKPPVFHFPSLS